MKPRFQADADFNLKILAGLIRREPSIDFRTAREGGIIGIPDPEVLRIAAAAGHVLVSHDRQTMPKHFIQLTRTAVSPGLIIVSQSLDIGMAIDELLLVWAAMEDTDLKDNLIFLPL